MNENTKPKLERIAFWGFFIVIIVLIVWGLVAANNKNGGVGTSGVAALTKPISSSDWTLGSSSAPVTLVEYADFECPACQSYYPILEQLIKDEGNKLFFVYRYFPLPQHPNAIISAEAAQAAGQQGQFWAMHDMLFANYADWEDLSDPTSVFLGYAQTIGISTTTFLKDLTSDTVDKAVTASYQDAVNSHLDYTPTLFVNGVRIDNPDSYSALKAIIDQTASSTAAALSATST